jgi:hypothetical protein
MITTRAWPLGHSRDAKVQARAFLVAANAASRTRGWLWISGLDACASPRNDEAIDWITFP